MKSKEKSRFVGKIYKEKNDKNFEEELKIYNLITSDAKLNESFIELKDKIV
jgi:hypothetical protein